MKSNVAIFLLLTETEITHIMDALDGRVEDLRDTLALGADPMIEDEIAELTELSMDLFKERKRFENTSEGTKGLAHGE